MIKHKILDHDYHELQKNTSLKSIHICVRASNLLLKNFLWMKLKNIKDGYKYTHMPHS